MRSKFNNPAVNAVFDAALQVDVTFASTLLAHGIGDRNAALPYAHAWAYNLKPEYRREFAPRERGEGFEYVPRHGSAPERAVSRVLDVIFGSASPKSSSTRKQVDPVKALVKKYKALTAAQQRRFRSLI